ncbi:MAG: DNA polymerase III subunit gamma/tau [Planctomycetia bacterium]|nr:DNA polymerase III subunit gamma/tau [Planctomycetia bacterium]
MDTDPLVPDSGLNLVKPDADNAYQVVARRYRPQGFPELIGQEHVAKALSNAITTGRIGHAYLFTGARGVGKTSTARIFAKALNCVHGPTIDPCNECEICLGINSGQDVDVLEIDGASNRSIEDVKSIRANSSFKPSRCRFKIYIIDEVHMLTKEAFNALLKTLEEPPEHVKFIFCTTEPGNIPITILSRCQRFDFAGIDSMAISQRLEQIALAEGARPESGVCDILARRANGSMRDAQSLLEQLLAFAAGEIKLADVHAMLGTVDDQKLFDLLAAIESASAADLFPILDRAIADGTDLVVLVEQLVGMFRDLMVLASGCPHSALIYTPQARSDELDSYAQSFGIARILASIQILDQTLQRMRFSTQGRILTEIALVRLVHLDRLGFVSKLIDQLQSGRLPDLQLAGVAGSEQAERPSRVQTARIETASVGSAVPLPVGEPSVTGQETKSQPNTSAQVTRQEPGETVRRAAAQVPAESSAAQPAGHTSAPAQKAKTIVQEDRTPPPAEAAGKWIPLATMTDELATTLWRQMLSRIQGQTNLVVQASAATRIHFERPNLFTVFFPADATTTKQFCQSRHKDLCSAFSIHFPDSIKLNFALEEPTSSPENGPGSHTSSVDRYKNLNEVRDNPMVQKACDLFDAEVFEVR